LEEVFDQQAYRSLSRQTRPPACASPELAVALSVAEGEAEGKVEWAGICGPKINNRQSTTKNQQSATKNILCACVHMHNVCALIPHFSPNKYPILKSAIFWLFHHLSNIQ